VKYVYMVTQSTIDTSTVAIYNVIYQGQNNRNTIILCSTKLLFFNRNCL